MGGILGIILLLAVYYFIFTRKHKRPVDYYNLFMMGVVFSGIGVPLKNYALSMMGVVFLIAGLVNKKKWKQNRRRWDDLDYKEKKIRLILTGLILFMFILGLVLFLIFDNGVV